MKKSSLVAAGLLTCLLGFNAMSSNVDGRWRYMKTITIDCTNIDADLTNFPFLLSITDTDLATNAQTDGGDIAFAVDGDTAILDHEIQKFDAATGELLAWIKVPTVTSATDTVLVMYYGNELCENRDATAAAWSQDFVLVQHLDGTSATYADSSPSGNDAVPVGVVQGVTGKVGTGVQLDDLTDRVTVPDSDSLDLTGQITMEGWFCASTDLLDGAEAWYGGMYKQGTCFRMGWQGWTDGWTMDVYSDSIRSVVDSFNCPMVTGVWNYVATTYDGTSLTVYVNGIQKNTRNIGSVVVDTSTYDFIIGPTASNNAFPGSIDEVRLASTARSADWIKANYENQSNPTAFSSVGTQTTNPAFEMSVMPSVIPGTDGGGVSTDFWIGLTEITVDSYVAFLNSAESAAAVAVSSGSVQNATSGELYCATATSNSDSPVTYDDQAALGSRFSAASGMGAHPMVLVSWFGAAAYCNWLSGEESLTTIYDATNGWSSTLTNTGYRLPTEDEWYKAAAWDAGAGIARDYGVGADAIEAGEVNYLDSGDGYEGNAIATAPVASCDCTSSYGIYDASGNVWEWCHGFFDAGGADEDVDPHAARGGSWGSLVTDTKTDTRTGFKPGLLMNTVGFRVVTLTNPQQ